MVEFNLPNKNSVSFYRKHFKVLFLMLILILIVPGYFLLIKPERGASQELKISAETKAALLAQNLKKLGDYKKIIDNYEKIDPAIEEKIREILPAGIDAANLYVNLQSIADKNNVLLGSINVSLQEGTAASKKKPNTTTSAGAFFGETKSEDIRGSIGKVGITITLSEVSYAKLKSIFKDLETNLRLFDIESFSYDAPGGTASIVLTSYYLE
jgi:uncharacterized protein (UPF0333 family)